MLKKLLQPHSLIITVVIFLFIWLLNSLRLNMHYLDPFNNGIKDYEITDIVYAYLADRPKIIEDRIVIINSGQPDRLKFARLLNRLDTAGAAAIGMDFFFEDLKQPATDSLLQAALRTNDKIVLACELIDAEPDNQQFEGTVGVAPYFAEHGHLAYVNFPSNETKTIRLFSPGETVQDTFFPAFATRLVELYDPAAAEKLLSRNNTVEYIAYTGSQDDFLRLDLSRALDSMSMEELSYVIRDKIVLVGYAPDDIWANPILDRHYTPLNKNYGRKAIPDMYGIAIHANVISMVLDKNYIQKVPDWLVIVLAVIFCYFNVLLIHWIYNKFHEAFHGITRGLQVVEFILIFLLIALLFYYFQIKIDFGLGILALLLAYDVIMIYESLIRSRIPVLARIPEYIDLQSFRSQPKQHTSAEAVPPENDKQPPAKQANGADYSEEE